jgi:hypothetical protein
VKEEMTCIAKERMEGSASEMRGLHFMVGSTRWLWIFSDFRYMLCDVIGDFLHAMPSLGCLHRNGWLVLPCFFFGFAFPCRRSLFIRSFAAALSTFVCPFSYDRPDFPSIDCGALFLLSHIENWESPRDHEEVQLVFSCAVPDFLSLPRVQWKPHAH